MSQQFLVYPFFYNSTSYITFTTDSIIHLYISHLEKKSVKNYLE